MSYNNITFYSNSLGKQSNMLVYVPDDLSKAPFKVVYQLHGLSDDATMYLMRSNISRYAEDRGLMLVFPDGGRGFYTNSYYSDEYYEDHILETVEFIDKVFNTSKKRENRFIGGLSMGGYGAMRIGLKNTDKFASIAVQSSNMDIKGFYKELYTNDMVGGLKRFEATFGPLETFSDDNDLFYLVKKYGNNIRIHFDIGTEDFLLENNKKFQKFLVENNIEHEFETYPGCHSWDYWEANVARSLDFHLENKFFS